MSALDSIFRQLDADPARRCRIHPLAHVDPRASIADGVCIGSGAVLPANVDVRSSARIGDHAVFVGGATTVVGAGASIGANATIHAGVTIGASAVVEPGAVVTASVPDSTVAAGNPATVVVAGRGAPAAAAAEQPPMKQTPAHGVVNRDLLGLMLPGARRVVEIGCMHGALARAYLDANPSTHYTGIDIDADYAAVARGVCDVALSGDIEKFAADDFAALFPSDCWVFGDVLEHLRDPWRLLASVRRRIDADGHVVVCLPNAQHWSVQLRLAGGQFRYEDSGLLDRTHLRWFTRVTMLEMFDQTGWRVDTGFSRRVPAEPPAAVVDALSTLARVGGADPAQAVADATAYQFLMRLRPA